MITGAKLGAYGTARAVIVVAFSSVFVVTNSLCLRRFQTR